MAWALNPNSVSFRFRELLAGADAGFGRCLRLQKRRQSHHLCLLHKLIVERVPNRTGMSSTLTLIKTNLILLRRWSESGSTFLAVHARHFLYAETPPESTQSRRQSDMLRINQFERIELRRGKDWYFRHENRERAILRSQASSSNVNLIDDPAYSPAVEMRSVDESWTGLL